MRIPMALAALTLIVGCNTTNRDSTVLDDTVVPDEDTPEVEYTADNCLDGQDLTAADVDITNCPAIPRSPKSILHPDLGTIRVGQWELEIDSEGEDYKIGSLNDASESPRRIGWGSSASVVDDANLDCWAKNYYRLRAIMQNPPTSWVVLRKNNKLASFYQYQVDKRYGVTGFANGIRHYGDNLIKWVSIVDSEGQCDQTTLTEFDIFAKQRMAFYGLKMPTADTCLDGQDLNKPDVDVSLCPEIPRSPGLVNHPELGKIRLGSWELEVDSEGNEYKIGSLNDSSEDVRTIGWGSSATKVDDKNITCWTKNYYRLRSMLQDPPLSWRTLRANGKLTRFFQYQTDKRYGQTGYATELTAYGEGLIKWVSVIDQEGNCDQATLAEFDKFSTDWVNAFGLEMLTDEDTIEE